MTCDEGHAVYGEDNDYWTSCCDTDNCNSYDPRDVLPTETQPAETDTTAVETTTELGTTEEVTTDSDATGIKCLVCHTNTGEPTEEEIENCKTGQNLETMNCEEEGWGAECIAR